MVKREQVLRLLKDIIFREGEVHFVTRKERGERLTKGGKRTFIRQKGAMTVPTMEKQRKGG